ncbi:MAG: hypothetical protein KatS3mg129_1668 [Leptospiraceae bacterium]|nr:MAG: hypothetical protein KatS3mg129_1668 [Leptospiraceae bacterium]
MEEPLTRTQAHRLFGELYNKPRPPDLQKKVDEIVSKYSDIFVRIKKIQELDQQYEKRKQQDKSILIRNNRNRIKSEEVNQSKKQLKKIKKAGFLERLLKGGEIPTWGEETGTLIHGLFGFNLRLSPNIYKTFNLFDDKQIIDAIKAMAYFIQKGWDDFPPSKYNIIITTYQFFKEYINVYSLLKKIDDISIIIQQTLKMQILYANLLLFPNYKSMIENEFIEWLKKQKDIQEYIPNTISIMRMIANLENRRPKFTDVILSFYVLERKKIITWNELTKELGIKQPVMDRYRAPEKILQIIHQKIDKLKLEIDKREQMIKDINYIKNKYFLINERGKINIEFLNSIVIQILKRNLGDARVTKELLKHHISEPHRLLHTLLQDFDLNFLNFFTSTISIQDQKGQTQDVTIFKPIVFKKEIELYTEIEQDLQEFLKQYKNAQLTFQSYYLSLKSRSKDVIMQNFIRIINKCYIFFRKMIHSIRIILENHQNAIELEMKGKLKEGVQRTKLIPIEDVSPQPRFIPYADSKIYSAGRINDFTVKNALDELVKDFYNYLYLYRDPVLLENFSAIPKLQSEIEIYTKKLLQYGVERKK